jgi:branched-chain amino acid transport system ATP-binding protein
VTMSDNLLELDHVTMKFGGVTALDDVTFAIRRGEILGLIGPNGAGKTTCFNVVTGVYAATSGGVHFDGTSLAGLKRFQITKRGMHVPSKTFVYFPT